MPEKEKIYKTVNKHGTKKGCHAQSEETKRKIAVSQKLRFNIKQGMMVLPWLQDYIADALIRQDEESGMPYSTTFIDNFLHEAKEDPSSPAGRTLASLMFSPDLLQNLDKRVAEEQNKNIDFSLYRIRQTLYDKQQEVFDNNLDKTLMNFSGRRSGKSELNQRIILKQALRHKDSICLYLNRNFDNAISQGYDTMVKVLEDLNIQYTGSRGNGVITLFNGTEIFYRGASNTVDIDRFRGVSKLACAIIDEAGHIKGLRYLLTEVLQPATIDIADSQIILTGTPPRAKNYAYQLWHNSQANIKKYNWNFYSNPFIPNRDEVISEVAKLYGVSEDSTFIRREYLGDMEALDDDARVFPKIVTAQRPPNTKVYERIYFGIDFGYEDDAAVVCFIADKQEKKLYQLDEWHAPHKALSDIAAELQKQYDKWTVAYKCAKTPYIITDTNEKSGTLDLATTYHFKNVMTAFKYDKSMALKQLSQLMNTDQLLLLQSSYLVDEAENMIWQRDPESDKIVEVLDDDAYHANGMMATLYISRQFCLEVLGWVDKNKPAKDILYGR